MHCAICPNWDTQKNHCLVPGTSHIIKVLPPNHCQFTAVQNGHVIYVPAEQSEFFLQSPLWIASPRSKIPCGSGFCLYGARLKDCGDCQEKPNPIEIGLEVSLPHPEIQDVNLPHLLAYRPHRKTLLDYGLKKGKV